jgi:hypothetical protein
MKTVILRTHKRMKNNSFSDALFRTLIGAPPPENSDPGEKDALFDLDTQITNSFCFLHLDFSKIRDINFIQGVSEISTLILIGNRTHQKEQLFSLPFWRKTLRSGLKK